MSQDHEIKCLTDNRLFEACSTRIAFTMRLGGASEGPFYSLNCSTNVDDAPRAVSKNRELICDAFGAGYALDSLIVPNQVHGTNTITVHDAKEDNIKAQLGADSIICCLPNIPVLLCFADCVPVVLVAPGGAFSVIHSGWRGTIADIAGRSLDALVHATSCLPSEVNCYIGPHIHSCCYEVDEDMISKFVEKYGPECEAAERHLDLSWAVRSSLLNNGADNKRIFSTSLCTSCHTDLFYSYRAEHGTTGRHGAFAMRKERS